MRLQYWTKILQTWRRVVDGVKTSAGAGKRYFRSLAAGIIQLKAGYHFKAFVLTMVVGFLVAFALITIGSFIISL